MTGWRHMDVQLNKRLDKGTRVLVNPILVCDDRDSSTTSNFSEIAFAVIKVLLFYAKLRHTEATVRRHFVQNLAVVSLQN